MTDEIKRPLDRYPVLRWGLRAIIVLGFLWGLAAIFGQGNVFELGRDLLEGAGYLSTTGTEKTP